MANEHDTVDNDAEDTPESTESDSVELPADVIEEATRLTRRARAAVDQNEATGYREARRELLADYEFTTRIREEDDDVLVFYPEEWVEDGTVRPERIEDTDRGVERPLEGAGDPDNWETVAEYNDSLAAEIKAEYGPEHGANARALAEFMNNHYAKPIEDATDEELSEFLTDYYQRNVWPTDDQKAVIEESVQLVREHAVVARQE